MSTNFELEFLNALQVLDFLNIDWRKCVLEVECIILALCCNRAVQTMAAVMETFQNTRAWPSYAGEVLWLLRNLFDTHCIACESLLW